MFRNSSLLAVALGLAAVFGAIGVDEARAGNTAFGHTQLNNLNQNQRGFGQAGLANGFVPCPITGRPATKVAGGWERCTARQSGTPVGPEPPVR